MSLADQFSEDEQLIATALRNAGQTRLLRIQRGERHRVAVAVNQLFGSRPVAIVADSNTFQVAGCDVLDGLRGTIHAGVEPCVFDQCELHADYRHVETLRAYLAKHEDSVAVAVGSGTVNDLTKLASYQLQRPYLVLATAASMDGYSSFGASITQDGFKKTIECAAPAGILADLDVLEAAPRGMNAAGYADLLAKSVAGADWLIADALEVEPIDRTAWEMVHGRFRSWVSDPAGIRRGDSQAIYRLMLGLTMSGFAMQWAQTSRPASGAEHQFSHLWDMQQLKHLGRSASHGFQVGIGTLASSVLYDELLSESIEELDVERATAQWPDLATLRGDIERRFATPTMVDRAVQETRRKYVGAQDVKRQLMRLRTDWPELRKRLQAQLFPFDQLRQLLMEAGCPVSPLEIGVSPAQLRQSYLAAYFIRSRFTVLDLAARTGLFARLLDRIFGAEGRWPRA